ncbi:putative reverse transcriptase domain-containing protein [Tanacetum coccineum]
MAMTTHYRVRGMILEAQSEAFKQENVLAERLHGLDWHMEKKEGESLYFMDRIGSIIVRRIRKMTVYIGDARQQLQKALGMRLDMSTAYHPQMDGQSERTIQTLKDMLRACVINFGGSWDVHLPLAEFSYNNSYHSSIRLRFGKKSKLALRYVEPFKILERISHVAYRLRLPKELSGVHDTFHLLNLKKCLADASLHVSLDEIKVDKTLCFVEELER